MNLSKPDLKIQLSPSQLMRADEWLNNFYSKCKSRMSDPVVEDGFLKISSADIYNFITAIEVTEHSRFDWQRLRVTVQNNIKQLLLKKREPMQKKYYVQILEMF